MGVSDISIIYHVAIVLVLLWFLSSSNPVPYLLSLFYLYLVHDRYMLRLRRNIQFEERRQANQKRVLTDSETVRWLNHAVEKIWPICMEQIVSQKILLPIVPWFLQKYKPWTVKDAVVQSLYMGRSPPSFTEIRVLRDSSDDHLVLQLGMNFRTAEDMSALLAVKLTKRLGFGMWAKLHLTGMHIEGKVLVGVKFINRWPFLGRLRVCFVEPPYFQMTVKPLIAHGLDVTELPGIAGWIDKLMSVAFEETLVEPNMLVVDVEKFASPESTNSQETWFSVEAKEPIAYVLIEVVEAADMKPSDLNGLADPYVKGQIGPYRFRTKTQRKTLCPKWSEEFKIPITTWESSNILTIEVRDKDHFTDDTLGVCSVSTSEFRDGQRHDMWLPLENIKFGRLHLAVTVTEINEEGPEEPLDVENENKRSSSDDDTSAQKELFSSEESPKLADRFEPIDIQGISETGLWVHQPGSEVEQISEHKKGKSRGLDIEIRREGHGSDSMKSSLTGSYQSDGSSSDGSEEGVKEPSKNRVKRGLKKFKSVFHKSPKDEDKTRSMDLPEISPKAHEEIGPDSPSKNNAMGVAKSIMKHAGKSVQGIKHAFSKKGSNLSEDASESARTDKDSYVGCVSDEDDSLASVPHNHEVEEVSSVISNRVSSDSVNSEDNVVRTGPSPTSPKMDVVEKIDENSVEGCEGVDEDLNLGNRVLDEQLSNPNGNGDGFGRECLDLKVSEERKLVEEQ